MIIANCALDPAAGGRYRWAMEIRLRPVSRRAAAVTGMVALLLAACGDGSYRGGPLTAVGQPAPQLAATPERPLKLLVVGGSSGIGLEVVRLALSRGHHVSVLSRHPERIALHHPRLQLFSGDVLDALKVARVVAGHDAVLSTTGTGLGWRDVRLFSEGTRNLLSAMRRSGVSRLIVVTGIGAGDSRGHGGWVYDRLLQPLLLGRIYADKDRQEALVRRSHSEWTIVRPGRLSNAPAERRYRVLRTLAGVRAGSISRADVAHFIVAAVEQEAWIGWTVLLSN